MVYVVLWLLLLLCLSCVAKTDVARDISHDRKYHKLCGSSGVGDLAVRLFGLLSVVRVLLVMV